MRSRRREGRSRSRAHATARAGGRRAKAAGSAASSGPAAVELVRAQARRDAGGHPGADQDTLGGVLALEVAGHLVQLGEDSAALEREQQLDELQAVAEGALDPVLQLLDPLARLG